MTDQQFRKKVWNFYRDHSRSLLWRETIDPYRILVSEVMLQQTQVSRVIPKYSEWLSRWPTLERLAEASTADILRVWQGLGYNRRALALQRAAQHAHELYDGALPNDQHQLEALPGVGPYTASAVRAFAFNEPVTMIETNIRAVYLHHYFPTHSNVSDEMVLPIIERTISTQKPREWYWGLMDYGAHLKSSLPNPSRKSRHHQQQSKFEGSHRQLRGAVIRILTQSGSVSLLQLAKRVEVSPKQLEPTLHELAQEGFIAYTNDRVGLAITSRQ